MNAREKFLSVMFVLALLSFVYELHHASVDQELARSLQKQSAQLRLQLADLTSERERLNGELAALRGQNRSMPVNPASAGKAEATAMRSQQDSLESTDPKMTNGDRETVALATSWADAVKLLKERLEQTPSAKIPELQFLTAADWLDVARNANLDTNAGYRAALALIRRRAEEVFTKKFQATLDLFESGNEGKWPASPDELKRYFFPPVEDAILQRWKIIPKTTPPGQDSAGDWVLTEKSLADPGFDSRWMIDSPTSSTVGQYQPSIDSQIETYKANLAPALKSYMAAHDGQKPADLTDLTAYASGPGQIGPLSILIAINRTNHVAY